MMKKIITTMLYGSLKAKVFLWSVFAMMMATVLMGVLAAVMGSSVFLMGAVTCGIAAFITSQSVSLNELNRKEKRQKSGKEIETPEEKSQNIRSKEEEEDADNPKARKEREQNKARYISSMNSKKMKQMIKEHKIRQSHIFVMIDSYPKMKIHQTPAIMWQTDTKIFMLVLDGSGREVELFLQDIKGVLYQKNVPANPDEDYPTFRYANFMSKLYKPFLPEYHEISQEGQLRFVKNLFTIPPGISFTNTSMAGIFKILRNVPLLVDDKLNMSEYFDEYFKEVYRYSILCKNAIISLDEYREKMEKVLSELVTAPITGQEFAKSLRDMNHYHLITSEYMTKYTQLYFKAMSGKK